MQVSLVAQMIKESARIAGVQVQSLDWEDLEKEMATHSSILAWEIPWTEEPGGLQSKGSKRVGHDRVTKHRNTKQILFSLLWKSHGVCRSFSHLCSMWCKKMLELSWKSVLCFACSPQAAHALICEW